MLTVTNLSVSYGSGQASVQALGPISFSLRKGDICAVIGPSGCGKSTLLHALCGILGNAQGSALLHGKPIDPRRQSIGFIPQDFGLLPWKTVLQNCLLPLSIRKQSPDDFMRARLDGMAERLGIAGFMERYPRELSGGQRQRASIARAFAMEPELLLMDEPFSALDALTREGAQELFLDMWRQYGTTTLFVTHSIEEAAYMGGRILVLSPRPGVLMESIDSPCFGMENPRGSGEYVELCACVREIVNKRWGA